MKRYPPLRFSKTLNWVGFVRFLHTFGAIGDPLGHGLSRKAKCRVRIERRSELQKVELKGTVHDLASKVQRHHRIVGEGEKKIDERERERERERCLFFNFLRKGCE